jgi:hypothetical protein
MRLYSNFMLHYIIIIVVLLILLVIVSRIINNDPAKILDKSNGTYDEYAESALKAVEKSKNPQHKLLKANITRYNILENDPRAFADNPNITREIVQDYAAALDGNDQVAEEAGIRLADFAEEDALVRGILDTVAVRHNQTVINRVKQSSETAATPLEAIHMNMAQAIQHTNDRQNVHDTSVNDSLAATLDNLRATYSGRDPYNILSEAERVITCPYARQTLKKIAEGGYVSKYDCNELTIFAYVWDRCDHPLNAHNKNNLHNAISVALAECVEDGKIVCTMGRVTRILSSTVTLDFDNTIGRAMTVEAYKNEIVQEITHIIDSELQRVQKDPQLSPIATAYITGENMDNLDHDLEEELKDILRRRIDTHVATYSSILSPTVLNGIRDDCYIYALID